MCIGHKSHIGEWGNPLVTMSTDFPHCFLMQSTGRVMAHARGKLWSHSHHKECGKPTAQTTFQLRDGYKGAYCWRLGHNLSFWSEEKDWAITQEHDPDWHSCPRPDHALHHRAPQQWGCSCTQTRWGPATVLIYYCCCGYCVVVLLCFYLFDCLFV